MFVYYTPFHAIYENTLHINELGEIGLFLFNLYKLTNHMKQKINRYLKYIIVGISAIFLVPITLFALLKILFAFLPSEHLIIANDTDVSYTITPILQSHDNAELYRDEPISIAPTDTVNINMGFDRARCFVIEDVGNTAANDSSIESIDTQLNFIVVEKQNFRTKVSILLANTETNPCLILDYIGKVPPAKISPEQKDAILK